MNYYNEFDSKAAAWLQELINQKLIPNGKVDTRSITDVSPDELREFTQCHFFAGISGWSLALQLAGWPADRPVWSMSCPCQPFSTAGKQLGNKDERHLWPVAFNLIKECRPEYVFGEQVASAIGKGWLDGVSTDLGKEGYACGSAVLGAHSVGSPHIRQRLYWVAYDTSAGLEGSTRQELQGDGRGLAWGGEASGVAQPSDNGTRDNSGEAGGFRGESVATRAEGIRQAYRQAGTGGADSRSSSGNGGVVNSKCSGLMGSPISNREPTEARREKEPDNNREPSKGCASSSGAADTQREGREGQPQPMLGASIEADRSEPEGFWSNYTLIPCRDGKTRRIPTESSILSMVDGIHEGVDLSWLESGFPLSGKVEGRVSLLKGYGNAIVPAVAAEFIAAFMDIEATETALFY